MSEEITKPAVGEAVIDGLRSVSTATLTMQLIKRGIRRSWIAGTKPLFPGTPRVAGPAFTLRFIPMREDVATRESYAKPRSLREAIEEVPAGALTVIEARGHQGCGTLGDILLQRLKVRGCVGVVSDGAMRDIADMRAVGLPIFCSGVAAPPSITGLFFADWQLPIGCGDVAVFPGDIVVADEDGAVVVPRNLAAEIAEEAPEQDRFERFVQLQVAAGAPALGLYPPTAESQAAYERWCAAGEPEDWPESAGPGGA